MQIPVQTSIWVQTLSKICKYKNFSWDPLMSVLSALACKLRWQNRKSFDPAWLPQQQLRIQGLVTKAPAYTRLGYWSSCCVYNAWWPKQQLYLCHKSKKTHTCEIFRSWLPLQAVAKWRCLWSCLPKDLATANLLRTVVLILFNSCGFFKILPKPSFSPMKAFPVIKVSWNLFLN